MYDRLILLDYDVGGLGNTIFALLSLTSQNVYSTKPLNFEFNSNGNAHAIPKYKGFPNGEFKGNIEYVPERMPPNYYDIRIGHACRDFNKLHSDFPGSYYLKIICKEFGFIFQTLASYQKFSGRPTLENPKDFLVIGTSESEIIESYALSYYDLILEHWQYQTLSTVNTMFLDDIVKTRLQVIVDYFIKHFKFSFDQLLVDEYIEKFEKANIDLVSRTSLLYNIIEETRLGKIISFPADLEFYEKALLLACIAHDKIQQMPIYTESNFWKNSKALVNNLTKD